MITIYDNMDLILESCVETYEEAIKAESRGANRIELCSQLNLGGLTPSKELTKKLVKELNIPVKVMVRPRKGDFFYTNEEIKQMHRDILDFKSFGVFGVVFGVLKNDKSVNINVVNDLVSRSNGMDITFHKAIDETIDLIDAYNNLMNEPESTIPLRTGALLSMGQLSMVLENYDQGIKYILQWMDEVEKVTAQAWSFLGGRLRSSELPPKYPAVRCAAR